MAKHSLAKGKDLRVGKSIWTLEYNRESMTVEPKKSVIYAKRRTSYSGTVYLCVEPSKFVPEENIFEVSKIIFPSDGGVRPHNYDERPVQIFLNKRSALHWLSKWGTNSHPNFMVKDPNGN